MQTCATCRYKGEAVKRSGDDGEEYADGYFLCKLITHRLPWDHNKSQFGSSYVLGDSGYDAALCVADDFGCNRWEGEK